MTLEEAKEIAKLIAIADGGCKGCVTEMVAQFNKANMGFYFSMTDKKIENEYCFFGTPEIVVTPSNKSEDGNAS